MEEELQRPALSPAEWRAVMSRQGELLNLRESIGRTPFSSHALAALFLFDQPFGFSAQDVIDEREVAAYCAAMAARHTEAGDERTATTFRDLGARHAIRAEKIAALLPPLDEGLPAEEVPGGQEAPGQESPEEEAPGQDSPGGQEPPGQEAPGQGPPGGQEPPGQKAPGGQEAPGQKAPGGQEAPGQKAPGGQEAPGQKAPGGQEAPGPGGGPEDPKGGSGGEV
jgi:hypothetical protein